MAYEQTAQNHPSKHQHGETALIHSSLHKSLLELKPLRQVCQETSWTQWVILLQTMRVLLDAIKVEFKPVSTFSFWSVERRRVSQPQSKRIEVTNRKETITAEHSSLVQSLVGCLR